MCARLCTHMQGCIMFVQGEGVVLSLCGVQSFLGIVTFQHFRGPDWRESRITVQYYCDSGF